MPRPLVPIRVTIGLRNGRHHYPSFNQLPVVQAAGMDWSNYVDAFGLGWHYDRCCGHAVGTPESPVGEQFGCLIVPEMFAVEALTQFPNLVTRFTEAELAAFYDTHCHGLESEEIIDTEVLQGIQAKQALGLTLTEDQKRGLDPTNQMPGLRKNLHRHWVDYKALTDTIIVERTP